MGYRMPRREAVITFEEGTDFHGAEVRVLLDVEIEFHIEHLKTQAGLEFLSEDSVNGLFDSAITTVQRERDRRAAWAEKCLLGWNLEDEKGKAVAATPDNFNAQPPWFCALVMEKWLLAAGKAPASLVAGSTATGPSARNGST